MSSLRHYRDDGPLVELLAAAVRRPPRAALPWSVAAAAPLLGVLVLPDSAALALAVGALLAAGSAAPAHRSAADGPLDWLVTPLLRAAEYGALLRLAVLDGPATVPACYLLLAALAYHHYDLVYRLRDRGEEPSRWLRRAGLGWEGRLLAAAVLSWAGALEAGMYAAGVVLLVTYVAEGVAGWRRTGTAGA